MKKDLNDFELDISRLMRLIDRGEYEYITRQAYQYARDGNDVLHRLYICSAPVAARISVINMMRDFSRDGLRMLDELDGKKPTIDTRSDADV